MQITRTSQLSGITRTREIDVTLEQLNAHTNGIMAQKAFKGLSESDREFIMTGITDEEWDEAFGEEDDETLSEFDDEVDKE